MKNIHVLPTDKPSRRLVLFNGTYRVEKGIMNYPKEMYPSPQGYDIYITNDEEIKDIRPHKDKWQLEKGSILNKFPNYLTDLSECKLVIMTTNQDLIKDGVQAIDDEFLEWFVKNPTCEFVNISFEHYKKGVGVVTSDWKLKDSKYYKIIIPKEESRFITVNIESAKGEDLGKVTCIPLPIIDYIPKQETFEELIEERIKGINVDTGFRLVQQETLEEVAEKTADNFEEPNFKAGVIYGVIEGAKWKQGKMYSEEDMIKAIKFGELYQKSGQRSLFEKKGKTPSQAIEHFIKSFNKK